MDQILKTYYSDNAKKLRQTVDRILRRFGGLSDQDKDDFYSLANEVFVDAMNRYDPSQSFDGFLYSCLSNRIKTEITKRNCQRRKVDGMTISLDTPVGDGDHATLGDLIVDGFDMERELIEDREEGYSRRVLLYLSKLSSLQKKVLQLNMEGYLPNEIREELHMDERQYADCSAAIHSYRNVSVLL